MLKSVCQPKVIRQASFKQPGRAGKNLKFTFVKHGGVVTNKADTLEKLITKDRKAKSNYCNNDSMFDKRLANHCLKIS